MTNSFLKNYLTRIKRYHREVLISFCVLAVILVRFVFPARLNGELFWISLALFLIFPWLIIKYILKEDFKNYGISWGNWKKGAILSVTLVILLVVTNYFVMQKSNLRNSLQISPDIVKSFWTFLWFQLIISLPIHFSSEFFFRGFLQLGIENKTGKYSILIQAIAQTMLYARGSWVILSLVGLSSLAAGAITNQSRSIFYSFVSMWLISISLDIMIIRYLHQGIINI